MSNRVKGKVKFYDSKKGFGFVIRNDGKGRVHIGRDSYIDTPPFDGDLVEFEVVSRPKGPHAIKLKIPKNKLVKFFEQNILNLDDKEKVDYDDFCNNAKKYAERLKGGKVTTSAIRNVYSRIMNATNVSELKMLQPQFAYIAGKNDDKNILREFMDLLIYIVKDMEVENKEKQQLDNFKRFMEAIVAYRKYVGGDK